VTLGEALARQYEAHGLPPDGGESDPSFRVRLGPFTIRLPNPPPRKRAVFFHDANHILTGYDTVFSNGEMLIAGFELASGCGPYWIAWLINLDMFALGLLVRPTAMFRAFVRGRRSAASMYSRPETRSALSTMTVDGLRALIGLDRTSESTASESTAMDRLLFFLCSIAAVVTIAAPLAAALLLIHLAWPGTGST